MDLGVGGGWWTIALGLGLSPRPTGQTEWPQEEGPSSK